MASDAQAFITQPVKRGKSLVRPERERIDPNHRQYHYRQAASQAPADTIQPSRTGNLPRTLSTKSYAIRRGKSVLGREEKGGNEADFEYEPEPTKSTWKSKIPGPWMTYCYLITCCVPPQLLSCAGNTKTETVYELLERQKKIFFFHDTPFFLKKPLNMIYIK